MKIKSIKLKDISAIKEANIKFDDNMNIICGPNGIGKTTILNALCHAFIYYDHSKLKRRINAETIGEIHLEIENNAELFSKDFNIDSILPDQRIAGALNEPEMIKKCIFIGVSRIFGYTKLESLQKDRTNEHSDWDISEVNANGIKLIDMKNWFAKRTLFSGTPNALTSNNLKNLEIAKNSFSIFNPSHCYSRTDSKNFDIFVNTPNGEIWYEYLSSGFKSCLSIVFGIIKEIEYRMDDERCLANEFDGVVLIDELDLHLHPEWQAKISSALQQIFPKIQFIVTTHSPHIVQSAKGNQIIALASDQDGITYVRDLPNSKYGYLGWTIDEVLQDVMGMKSTQSDFLNKILSDFDNAIDDENIQLAKEKYQILKNMLHRNNPLRKMINIDFKSIGGKVDD